MGEIELYRCDRLNARISAAQCRRNQDAARQRSGPGAKQCFNGRQPYIGLLHNCLDCPAPITEVRAHTGGAVVLPARPEPIIAAVADTVLPRQVIEKFKNCQKERKNMTASMTEVEIEKPQAEPAIPIKYCKNHPDRPVFERKGGLPLNICKECLSARLKAGQRRAREKWATAGESMAKATWSENVVLDFTGREELLMHIREIAEMEERTVQGQILYWLKKHLREATS